MRLRLASHEAGTMAARRRKTRERAGDAQDQAELCTWHDTGCGAAPQPPARSCRRCASRARSPPPRACWISLTATSGASSNAGSSSSANMILWEKGQAARLSEFGAKLLLAERQAGPPPAADRGAARGSRACLHDAFDDSVHVVLHASHDGRSPRSARRARAATWTSASPAASMRSAR